MIHHLTRRNFVSTAAAATLAGSIAPLAAAAEGEGKSLKILGVACSPRRGMTTAKAVQAALDAATSVDARIQVELIDLGGTLLAAKDDISGDELGLSTARNTGLRVADFALKLAI
jgi:hypothetical protein